MTNKRYYPVYLDLTDKRVLIVGGGAIASRKARGLLDIGANVKIVSPEVTDEIRDLAAARKIEWVAARYETAHMDGAAIVVGATSDRAANEQVSRDAMARSIPVNIVDDPALCSFIVPAVGTRGAIQIAVSTGGSAPMVAGKIRDRISQAIGDEYVVLVEVLGVLRDRIRALDSKGKRAFWREIREFDVAAFGDGCSGLGDAVESLLRQAEGRSCGVEGARE